MALYVVATPIGNLEDLSPRASKALAGATVVACEDTRRTQNLMRHLGLHKPLVRYDGHVHGRESPRLLARLAAGEDVALVSDAGTPGVSDPGGRLIAEAVANGVKVVPVPGPSALLAALAGSGLPMDAFTFLGFLSRRGARIRRELESAGRARTIVFLESVFRLEDTLGEAKTVFGDVPCAVGRELTKMHEEFIRGTISQVAAEIAARKELKGEATVVLAPQPEEPQPKNEEEILPMIHVSVVGATGYTGGELLKVLKNHPEVRVAHVTSESSPGKRLDEVHPDLRKDYDLVLETYDAKRLARDTDLAFFALPHGVGSKSIAQFLAAGGKVVDLSADFRLKDLKTYESWYKVKHASPKLLKEAVYGLPELFRKDIPGARLVANPGCYATTAILALAPLLKANAVDPSTIVVDAKSGVSGAGKKLDAMYHFPDCAENFQPYGVNKHRHMPEIEQALLAASGRKAPITFVPHLVPMTRGILACAYAKLKRKTTDAQVRALFEKEYGGERFIRLLPEGRWPRTKDVSHNNYVDVNTTVDERTGRVIVMAALDNLVKGAAGQAVQNMNLMSGFDETAGLIKPKE